MKKLVSLMLVMLMTVSCLVLVSCGGGSSSSSEDLSSSKYVGTWKAITMSLEDTTEAADEGGEFIVTLNGDGTGQSVSRENGGEEEVTDFTWELTDDGFKTKGDMKLKFTDDGDNIKANIFGVDLVFEKQ